MEVFGSILIGSATRLETAGRATRRASSFLAMTGKAPSVCVAPEIHTRSAVQYSAVGCR